MSAREPSPRTLSDAWLARRAALHERYLARRGAGDASQLVHLLGEPTQPLDAAAVRDLWASRPPAAAAPRNHVYLHVPFCKSICSFCNYERLRPSHPSLLTGWLERLEGAVRALAPGLRGTRFHTLYVGGGTPVVLSADQLRRAAAILDAALDFHPQAGRHIEADPALLTADRIRALADAGFQHVSMGVQTLEAEVNRDHVRGPQGREMIDARFAALDAAGIGSVTCDFLLGLAGTEPGQILAEIEEVLRRHAPHWIDVYLVTPTPEYLASHFGGDRARFEAHLRPFQEQAPPALAAMARRAGYRLQSGHGHGWSLNRGWSIRDLLRLRRRRARIRFGYTQLVHIQGRPLNLLGLGPSARSRIFGRAALTCEAPEGAPWRWRGRAGGAEVELRRFLVHALRDRDRLPLREVQRIFGLALQAAIPEAIAAWSRLGVARIERGALQFTSQLRAERLAALMWLVPDAALERAVAQAEGLDLSAEGLARRLRPLAAGSALGTGYQLASVGPAQVELLGDGGERVSLRAGPGDAGRIEFRVAGGLPEGAPERAALKRSVALLRRVAG